MKIHLKTALLASTIIAFNNISLPAMAEENDHASTVMERVMVIGSAERAQDLTGSAQFIDEETLDEHKYTDINRVL